MPIHYGMKFIIMNPMDEVLCMNKWNEIKIKHIKLLDSTDRICFKVLDLGDQSNPGILKYGAPMWLQVLEAAIDAENSWQTGYLLGAKVFFVFKVCDCA